MHLTLSRQSREKSLGDRALSSWRPSTKKLQEKCSSGFCLASALASGKVPFHSPRETKAQYPPPSQWTKSPKSADGIFPPSVSAVIRKTQEDMDSTIGNFGSSGPFGRECYVFKFCKKTETLLFPLSS